jgi:hypothetical protein
VYVVEACSSCSVLCEKGLINKSKNGSKTVVMNVIGFQYASVGSSTIQLHDSLHCGFEVNETADSKAKKSIKEGRDGQLILPVADLKTQWKKEGKEELHSFRQNTQRDRGESYFERYYSNGSSPWFREIKMNRRAFE